ncbi:hypothetical protein N8D56_20120 [Devosia sp. A8/3-2]|nr:hypothetical protein N8D56_20120 [Devosia sp. A8/3-2]
MTLTAGPAPRKPTGKKRLEHIFGRDWKVGYLFVLPMVLIMALLIFWPFVSAIFISTTSLNFLTGRNGQCRIAQLSAPVDQLRFSASHAEHHPVHLLVAEPQIRHRHDRGADPQ